MRNNFELDRLKKLKLDKLKKDLERKKNLPHLYGHKLYKWQREFFESKNKMLFLNSANQVGKDLWNETLIPVPNGFKKLKDIVVGDLVFGSDGNTCEVIDIPWDQDNNTYKIIFDDGSEVICGPHHEWICKGPEERFRKKSSRYNQWQVKTTREIIDHVGFEPENRNKYSIPVSNPIEREKTYLFDPYLIGLLIGDGSLTNGHANITSVDHEIIDYIKQNYFAKRVGNSDHYNIANLSSIIRYYELDTHSYNKKVPTAYKKGSIDQRLSLLQGLMDIDGSCNKKGMNFFYTTSEKLSNDVVEIVTSLGGKAEIKIKQGKYKKNDNIVICRICYTVKIDLDMPLYRIARKLKRQKFQQRYKHERLVVKIIPWKRLRTRCLTVSSPDHSFLCTKSHIVTHNSSIQIKKMIHWATETSLWPELWPSPPRLFWYLYPSLRIADSEFLKKWKPEFLPQDQNDPKYGWTKSNNALGDIEAIHFHSGVSIYFKSYMTNEELLQTGSVWYLGFDEEMPIDLWPELVSRVGAPNIQGYISGVFTPTLSQQFWYDVMEERGTDKELLKGAHKLTTSLFDCTVYEDNTPSLWTREMITQRINSLPSQEEVQRRIYGRFIMSTAGRKFPSFNRDRNYKVNGKVPDDWIYFVGIDSGSGGTGAGHPAAITFLAVNPTYTEGRITMVWKGTPENVDGEDKSTTAGDILRKYLELSRDKNIAKAVYDFADADLGIIAERNGIALERANKSTSGVDLINTLFKNQILSIDINRATNNEELVGEFINLKKETRKTNAKDDTSDSARYAINEVPWDLSVISADSIVKVPNRHRLAYKDIDERRKSFEQPQLKPNEMILAEMEDLNELYDE